MPPPAAPSNGTCAVSTHSISSTRLPSSRSREIAIWTAISRSRAAALPPHTLPTTPELRRQHCRPCRPLQPQATAPARPARTASTVHAYLAPDRARSRSGPPDRDPTAPPRVPTQASPAIRSQRRRPCRPLSPHVMQPAQAGRVARAGATNVRGISPRSCHPGVSAPTTGTLAPCMGPSR